MASYAKYVLTGGTNGRIPVIANSEPGTVIHTAPTGTTGLDEVWLWAANNATTDREVYFTVGTGSTATDNKIVTRVTIPARDGMYQVLPGIPYNNGAAVRAVATATDGEVIISGYANRIAT